MPTAYARSGASHDYRQVIAYDTLANTMPAILTERLVKHYAAEIKAVDGIDLSVDDGQIFAFLGQNGSGKTTTVRMLTTLLRPTSGRAEVDGLDVAARGAAVRRRIGVALQEAGRVVNCSGSSRGSTMCLPMEYETESTICFRSLTWRTRLTAS